MKKSKKIAQLIICYDCHKKVPNDVEYIYFKNKYYCKTCYRKVLENIDFKNIDPNLTKIVTKLDI